MGSAHRLAQRQGEQVGKRPWVGILPHMGWKTSSPSTPARHLSIFGWNLSSSSHIDHTSEPEQPINTMLVDLQFKLEYLMKTNAIPCPSADVSAPNSYRICHRRISSLRDNRSRMMAFYKLLNSVWPNLACSRHQSMGATCSFSTRLWTLSFIYILIWSGQSCITTVARMWRPEAWHTSLPFLIKLIWEAIIPIIIHYFPLWLDGLILNARRTECGHKTLSCFAASAIYKMIFSK